MKPLDYVKKFELNINSNFNHNEFISDFTIDFITLLEVGKAKGNLKGFENAVRAIRMKWDGIDKKTVGQLPEKLWKYFYATVIAKMRENLFPEEMKRRKEDAEEWKRQQAEWKRSERENDDWLYGMFFASLFSKRIPEESFEILGLGSNASVDDVKTKFKSLAMTSHPDKGGSHDKMVKIIEAKNKCLAYLS